MIREKEEVSVPKVDTQSKRNEYGAEDDQSDDWYLEGICAVVQRKTIWCGRYSHRSAEGRNGNQDRKVQKREPRCMYFSVTLVCYPQRCYAVVVPCTTWAGRHTVIFLLLLTWMQPAVMAVKTNQS